MTVPTDLERMGKLRKLALFAKFDDDFLLLVLEDNFLFLGGGCHHERGKTVPRERGREGGREDELLMSGLYTCWVRSLQASGSRERIYL